MEVWEDDVVHRVATKLRIQHWAASFLQDGEGNMFSQMREELSWPKRDVELFPEMY